MKPQALTMYDYHAWANHTLLNRLKELPQEVYEQEITSVFPTLAKAVAHIYIVDVVWFHILSGKSMRDALTLMEELTRETDGKSAEEMQALYSDGSEQYKTLLSGLGDLEKKIVLDNPYAGVRETSLSEIVLQIVNHATYHRGNITAMLRQMGHASVMTEYALFWYS